MSWISGELSEAGDLGVKLVNLSISQKVVHVRVNMFVVLNSLKVTQHTKDFGQALICAYILSTIFKWVIA